MKAVILLATLILAGSGAPSAAQDRSAEALVRWASVLKRLVNDRGQVDFHGLVKHPSDLNAFVEYIAAVSPESMPERFASRESRLAYHINAYNALSMYNVVDSGIPKSLSGLSKVWFFGIKRFSVGGRKLSLYAYENEVIRPMGDERVHFALNCMSIGCPRLPRVPFTATGLDDQLDREARRFFGERRNLRLDPKNKIVYLSEIVKFYKEDFLRHSPGLIAYVNRYAPEKVPQDYRVEFTDYDWTVNDRRGGGP